MEVSRQRKYKRNRESEKEDDQSVKIKIINHQLKKRECMKKNRKREKG